MATVAELLVGPNSASGIRGRLQDLDDEAYSDNLLMNFLSDAQQDFALTGCCQDLYSPTPNGSYSFMWLTPTDQTLSIYAVTRNDVPLNFAPMSEARYWTPASGVPTAYTIWQNSSTDQMRFDTIPDTLKAINIFRTYIPSELSSTTTTLKVPTKWHTALKAYVEYRVRSTDREDGLADRAFAEYQAAKEHAYRIYEAMFQTGGPTK